MQFDRTSRRRFITLLGGAEAWPLAARAQQSERIRRIATLTGIANEEGGQERITIFVQTLAQLGWIVGRNARIESRWGGGETGVIRKHAAELVALAPDCRTGAGDVRQPAVLDRAYQGR